MKKRKILYGLTALLLLGTPLATLASCGDSGEPVNPNPDDKPGPEVDDEVANFDVRLSFNEGKDSIYIGEEVNVICSNPVNKDGDALQGVEYIFKSKNEEIASVSDSGTVIGLKEGTVTIEVTCRNAAETFTPKTLTIKINGEAPIATGGYSFVSSENPYVDKLEILGKLEKYAVEEHLTGITLFQNGGYVMYNDRIKKPTDNYITGYGFGILTEGEITKDMDKETNPKYKRYYHTFGGTSNKQKFNYLDDTGSESADLYGYITSSYYGTKMNDKKNGYVWYPLLAKNAKDAGASDEEIGKFDPNRPIPLNFNEGTGLATKYKVYVKAGEKDGYKYSTKSTYPGAAAFNDRYIQLEDYVTPYKLLLNQKMELARSTDFISDTGDGTLRGAKAFYNSCTTSNLEDKDLYGEDGKGGLFRALVGIETDETENSITFTFNNPISPFDAMVNLSGSLNSPIPQDFLALIAPDKSDANKYKSAMNQAYGTAIKDTDYTPRDTTISCGPYVVESTDSQNNIFELNKNYPEVTQGRYKIPGIKIQYFAGAASDKNFTFNKFIEDGVLDAVSIPKDFMDQYKNDPRTKTTEGDSTFKLNLNTFTQDEWDANEAFKQTGSTTTYKCKPLMSNDDFVNALSFALDRETFATSRGSVPSQSYFAPSYLWEPEKGLPYDETDQHKAVLQEYSPKTYGYNESIAVQLFDKAITDEINQGHYKSYKSEETININWMNPTDTDEYGKEIVGYFNKAFEKTEAYSKGFKINFNNINGSTDYQHVYDIMKKGTFDIAFGSVSGMQLDPLGFLEVIKSNNVTGFTTNWGTDTSKISKENPIIYQGKKWSFDGLWDAANKGAIINADGTVDKEPVKVKPSSAIPQDAEVTLTNDDGTKQQIAVKQLALNIEVASSTTFKMFASDKEELRSEEFITLVIDYKDGETKKSAALNIYYGKKGESLFWIRDNADIETITGGSAYPVINIPITLKKETTNGQIGTTINFDQITNITAYVNCYMVINDVPTTSQVSCVLKLK